jgi:hypothetical protein
MDDPGPDPEPTPDAPDPACQPGTAVTAIPDGHRYQLGQLTTRELDLYSSQLARCLKALGTDAPIRADVQRELAIVRAEQGTRARPGQPAPPAARTTSATGDGRASNDDSLLTAARRPDRKSAEPGTIIT